ncbi:MAG: hypothetical protein ABFD49_11100 [Armatimonadota bacterium]|nr:hypothetical protein [bacterium]
MPTTLLQLGSAGVMAYLIISILPKFLTALEKMGERWDAERKAAHEEAKAERDQFAQMMASKESAWREEREKSGVALMAIIGLAQKMVDNCQNMVPSSERVSTDEICAAARVKPKSK